MISTDFAVHITFSDARLALKLMLQPWKWQRGKGNTKLKRKLKKLFFSDSTHISLFLSGRTALYYYLKSLELHESDEVLVQGFTCEAVVLPILALNLSPIYVDCNEDDFSMNSNDLRKKLSDKSKVLILQHTFGITPTQRSEILSFAKEHKIIVIEDLAHGFNPSLFKKRFSSVLLLSFGRSKAFSGMFGGAIVTSSQKTFSQLKVLEQTVPKPHMSFTAQVLFHIVVSYLIISTYDWYFGKFLHFALKKLSLLIPEISRGEKNGKYNFRLSKSLPNCCAILALENLKRHQTTSKTRLKNVSYYQKKLGTKNTFTNALVRFPYVTELRDKIRYQCAKKNIYLGDWYNQVVAPKELDLRKVGYVNGTCTNAEKLSKYTLNLPTHVSQSEAQKIITLIENT